MSKNKISIDFLIPLIKKYQEGGKIANNVDSSKEEKDMGNLILDFLWVRDQAHVFHWQSKSNSHHVTLGEFYEEYIEELDELAESIFGKLGKTFSVGSGGCIPIVDLTMSNLKEYLIKIENLFTTEIRKFLPDNASNVGVYHTVGDILELIHKLKYLLSQT